MGKSSPPPAPDYTGAAKETAAGNLEAAKYTTEANRINQYTPYGSITYNQTPTAAGGTQWSMNQSLSPEQQALFNQNQQINQSLGNVAQQGLGYVQSALDKPLSFEGMQAIQDPGQIQQQASDAAYQNATQYLDPQFAQSQQAMESQLANQGITRGSEAFNREMENFGRQKQQAYGSARNQAYLQGLQGAGQAYSQGMGNRQQQITEAQTLQQNPLNMLNAVRSGQQMQTANLPQQLSQYNQQGVAGPDLLGAASATGNYNQGVYNAQQAGQSNMVGGLFGLGGAALGAGGWGGLFG